MLVYVSQITIIFFSFFFSKYSFFSLPLIFVIFFPQTTHNYITHSNTWCFWGIQYIVWSPRSSLMWGNYAQTRKKKQLAIQDFFLFSSNMQGKHPTSISVHEMDKSYEIVYFPDKHFFIFSSEESQEYFFSSLLYRSSHLLETCVDLKWRNKTIIHWR